MTGRLGLLGRVLAVVLVLAGVAAYVVMERQTTRLTETSQAGEDATRAARAAVPQVLGYTPSSLSKQLGTNRKLLTSDYSARFEKMVRTRVLPQANRFGVTNTVKVVSTAVVRASRGRATVLVFANQTTRTSAKPQGITQGTRLQVVLVRDGDAWLVDALEPV